MPYVCKKVKDGTHYNNSNVTCPGLQAGQVMTPVTINGEVYENFPMFDIEDGTTVTDQNGNEYYIRVLRPRYVYAEAPLSECASMIVGTTKETADHTFFNYPELSLPRVGAVLVNKLSNEPAKDPMFGGKKYLASNDDDNDGIPNSLDMSPSNPAKNKDVDFDGIEDSEDNLLQEYKFNWTKHLEKTMFSTYEKNKLN